MESCYVFLAFVCGWFIAQFFKLIVFVIKTRGKAKFSEVLYYMMKSGGMPSGHTASFSAVTGTIGFLSGFNSTVFALAVCMTSILIYDATNVRHSVGEHGEIINQLIDEKNLKLSETEKIAHLRVVEGHTVPEVVAGLILGILISIAINFLLIK